MRGCELAKTANTRWHTTPGAGRAISAFRVSSPLLPVSGAPRRLSTKDPMGVTQIGEDYGHDDHRPDAEEFEGRRRGRRLPQGHRIGHGIGPEADPEA